MTRSVRYWPVRFFLKQSGAVKIAIVFCAVSLALFFLSFFLASGSPDIIEDPWEGTGRLKGTYTPPSKPVLGLHKLFNEKKNTMDDKYPDFDKIRTVIESSRTIDPKASLIDQTVRISYFSKEHPLRLPYSRFRCSGDDNDATTWTSRTCLFMNVCYNLGSKQFYYYSKRKGTKFFEKLHGELESFSFHHHGIASTRMGEPSPFAPKIIYRKRPKVSDVHRLHNVHALSRHWTAGHDIGHILWEELGHIFYTQLRMGIEDPNLIIMHEDGVPDDPMYKHIMNLFMPALSAKPVVSMEDYVSSFNKSMICFDHLLVGGNVQVFNQPQIPWNFGQEPLFKAWRDRIMRVFDFDPYYVPKRHKIIIVQKEETGTEEAVHSIANIERIYEFLQNTYINIHVEMVNWDDMGMYDIIRMLLDTTIMISPPGSVSMMLPFLPDGAHAILIDYYNDYDYPKDIAKLFGDLKKGDSVGLESAFWGHFPHVKKLYYQVRNPAEVVKRQIRDRKHWQPAQLDSRDFSAVNVNEERLRQLIDHALESME
jgi:hypothetical protein